MVMVIDDLWTLKSPRGNNRSSDEAMRLRRVKVAMQNRATSDDMFVKKVNTMLRRCKLVH